MPTVVCPGCQKQYKLPETAIGQVANCKCGKRFRVGGGAPKPAAVSAATPSGGRGTASAGSKPAVAAKPQAAAATSSASDAFWDKALSEPVPAAKPAAPAPRPATSSTPTGRARRDADEKPAKKKQKKERVAWGFDWGKVGGGLLTFLVAGGITVGLALSTGRLFFWPAGIAIVGLFTALSGLMGEEGIW